MSSLKEKQHTKKSYVLYIGLKIIIKLLSLSISDDKTVSHSSEICYHDCFRIQIHCKMLPFTKNIHRQ